MWKISPCEFRKTPPPPAGPGLPLEAPSKLSLIKEEGGRTPSIWTLRNLIHHLRLDSWFNDQIPCCLNVLLLRVELEVGGIPMLDIDGFLYAVLDLCPDLFCRFTGFAKDPVVSFLPSVP